MPILDLHEDDLIQASEAAPAVAPRRQEPAFSAWATVKSAVKAVPAAVAEVTGSTADILGAFGGVAAATGGSAGGMFSTGTEAERKQTEQAAKKLREQGPDYRTEAGGLFRGVAKDYMPDPNTAHGAEVVVADFVRVATKAMAGGVIAGPLAGAVMAGSEEGFTSADKLAEQGVDVATRTQVGLVNAGVTGLGFALPVAGRTWAQTVGLALAGGPASFVAQNAATRKILQDADYTQLAEQYDPFDPVGLTLSTLIPLGFGAMAMRGAARRAAADGSFSRSQENGQAPVSPDVVDAARVQLLRENLDSHRPTPPEDFAAAQAHEGAVTRALDQMATGQRVEVAPLPDTASVPITENMAARLDPVRAELDALRLVETPPDVPVQAVRAADDLAMAPARAMDAAPAARTAATAMDPAAAAVSADPGAALSIDPQAIAREAADLLSNPQTRAELETRVQAVGQQITDTVEAMRTGRAADAPAPKSAPDAAARPASPMQARLDAEIVGNPAVLETKLPTAFDDTGRVSESVTVREFLDRVKAEADLETADANLLQVAANCFLMNGA